jgi:hypothetical protein
MSVVAAGLVAGSVHVVSGPDHLAAVLPLAAEHRGSAARLGAIWGLGHGLGVVVLGALGQLLKGSVDIEAASHVSELMVGVLLVVLGGWALWRSRAVVVHAHAHEHATDDDEHAHPHVHLGDRTVGSPRHAEQGHRSHHHSALGFGVLHGAAGAGHLFGVLPSLVLSEVDAALYLACYFVAAVGAMALFAAGSQRLLRAGSVTTALRVTGAVSMAVGVVWVGAAL